MSRRAEVVVVFGLIAPGCGPTTTGISTESVASTNGDGADTDTGRSNDGDSTGGPRGGTSPSADDSTSAAATDAAETTADDTADGSTAAGVAADCPALCSVLMESSCLTETQGAFSCETSCETVLADQSTDAHEAFEQCVQTNPLCFETPQACVWKTLYPDPIEQTIIYTGSGFEAFEGLVVRGGINEGNAVISVEQTTVLDGSFTLEFTELLPVLHSRLLLLYVDTDGDATCSPGVDLGDSVHVDVSGNFDAPAFQASGTPPESSQDFVCGALSP